MQRGVIGMMGLAAALSMPPAIAQSPSPEELSRQTLERRAIDGAIWGMPIVSVYAMRRGWFPYFRLYGPEKTFFNKTWKLPDIEHVR